MEQFLSDFRDSFPPELLPKLLEYTVQTHSGNPCGYACRAERLWFHASRMNYEEQNAFRIYEGRRYPVDLHLTVDLHGLIATAFACTQIRFYDLPDNWDRILLITGYINSLQHVKDRPHFKRLYSYLVLTLMALKYQRWWCVLAWAVYHRSTGSRSCSNFLHLLDGLQVYAQRTQQGAKRPRPDQFLYLLDDYSWCQMRTW